MVLAAEDQAAVRALWRKLGSNVHVYTTEALERTFLAFPSTETYFHLSPRSAQVRAHGEKVAFALTVALDHLDDLPRALSALRVLHSHKLRLDPVNFKLLGDSLLVTLAQHYPGDFSSALQASLDKFLRHVISALAPSCR
nr:hemoglobin subunit theta-1 [Vicugna pacos]